LQGLDISASNTKLLAIVANQRGAEQAVLEEKITYLGFPFSVSPTFQQLNANSTPEDSLRLVEAVQALCQAHQKQLVVYLSMGFGNPYGDAYHADILLDWLERLAALGIRTFSLSDTVGLATAEEVYALTQKAISAYANCTIGVHLHSTPLHQQLKLQAALDAGCTRVDGAILGIGGCPMAQNDLVGNMDTLQIVQHLAAKGIPTGLDNAKLREAAYAAGMLFDPS
jgi:hydroxymethylglutaryl-CoA lyase